MTLTKWSKDGKKYNKDWEKDTQLIDWICQVVGDQRKAMCRYCKTEIHAHHGDLLQHANTDKHKKNSKSFSSTRLTDIGFAVSKPSTINQKAELQLASYIACHAAVSSADHLGELLNSAFEKDLSIHRTKCTALINNVIAPCMFKDLLKDIGETQYSLVIDESTDIAMVKQLCVVQWDELKLHFQLCKDAKRCYDAEVLYQMYCDPLNKLYLEFLMPILHEFSRVNKLFQLKNGNAFKMLDCLQSYFRTLISRVITPSAIPPSDSKLLDVNLNDTANHLPVYAVNFGVQFTIVLGEAKLDNTVKTNMKNRCCDFLLEAAKQVQNRLPANINTWKSMASFSPNKPQLATVSMLKMYTGDLGALDA
ncbi:hypothetical protein DPX16_20063 [Anabarilius grahami]|uniref:DUF4371 domain-containing protein n=1 Tax=Anabarilius grahami TaxID=495550 RepID=A0A3N0XQK5_ANAGA|nr:hypothetical protein DPX16_20063 [Anabarilius grahami]